MMTLIRILDQNLGRCSRCMGQSFVTALCTWIATVGAVAFQSSPIIAALLLAAALVSTMLWIAHIIVFAIRVSVGGAQKKSPSLGETNPAEIQRRSRRKVISQFVRAAAVGVAATVSILPNAVFAAGNCDCSKCRSNQNCCPTANGYCGCFPMACPK